jgi:hypothetical protein
VLVGSTWGPRQVSLVVGEDALFIFGARVPYPPHLSLGLVCGIMASQVPTKRFTEGVLRVAYYVLPATRDGYGASSACPPAPAGFVKAVIQRRPWAEDRQSACSRARDVSVAPTAPFACSRGKVRRRPSGARACP